jgi:hypothetical protein
VPGDVEPEKVTELEQKLSDLKHRLAQGKTASEIKP